MNPTLDIFFHSCYVAFVFAVLFYGALVYRQILDGFEVKKLRMGEDRDAYVDGRSAWVVIVGVVILIPLSMLCYSTVSPSIYAFALPLVFFVQISQLAMRIFFQRTLVKTRGIVVRSVLFDRVKAAPFADVIAVRMIRHAFWVEVRIALPANEIGFRIFPFSAASLERLFATACTAPVLWIDKGADETRRTTQHHV
ncbi:MAG: hypothetical protein J5I53_06385 [Bradyrhizobiaceae bacterium]|nr:hypothetical protein [Bradyrhizobiaceae bacterium]